MKKVLLALSLVVVMCSVSYASPLTWSGNGHMYDFIRTSITWHNAKTQAEGLGGYLATITSSAENAFINSNFNTGAGSNFAWIGGYEPADNGVWRWATGPEAGIQFSNWATPTAPFNYANWGGIEPNDNKVNEDYAMYNIGSAFAGINPGQWADASPSPSGSDPVIGYVIEYPIPEPSSLLLLSFGLFGAGFLRKRRT